MATGAVAGETRTSSVSVIDSKLTENFVSTVASPTKSNVADPGTRTGTACSVKTPSASLSLIAAGSIPSTTAMQQYKGVATEIIATLSKLVPGSLNQLNAKNQVSSSLFQITESIRPGDAPVRFQGASFTNSSNAVVVLITSSQYKFNGLPTLNDIQVFNDATCTITINTAMISTMNGVEFSYILDSSYKSEWFAMELDTSGTKLTVYVFSEHTAIASIVFSVAAFSVRRGDIGFVVATGIQTTWVLSTVLKTATASGVVASGVVTSTPSLNVNVVVGAATTTQTISELLVVVFTVIVL
ncbi:hypothetical protein HDU99_002317 [Rhizoclosmatium hyalinum]|nr:hypothetical protein HDU99_002317 [Rhizoclosmatium hyalinum]